MIHPAARRRRKNRRIMTPMGSVGQQSNGGNEGQGWTWWQQLLGVEVLLGFFIIMWYYISYKYQQGINLVYDIPDNLIDLNISKLMEPLYISFYMTGILISLFAFTRNSKIERFFYLFLAYGFYIASVWAEQYDLEFKVFITITLVLMDGFYLIVVTISDRNNKWIKGKLPLENIFLFLNFLIAIFAMPLILSSQAFNYGVFTAEHQSEFYVIEQKKERKVVLNTYKDYYITAPLNPDNKTFKPEFELIPMYKDDPDPPVKVVKDTKELNQADKQEEPIVLKLMDIGPLYPEPPSTP